MHWHTLEHRSYELPASISPHLTYGAALIGVCVALLFYGVTCCQAIQYYRNYPDDRSFLKHLVFFVWVMDTTQQAFLLHMLWHYLIELRAIPDITAMESANWSSIAQVIPTEICAVVVESFFVARIWILDGRKRRILVLLLPMGVSFVFSVAFVVKCMKLPYFANATQMQWLLGVFGGLRALTDIVIAVVMCKFLYMHYKADLTQRTASMIKVLVHHTITTGLLTSVSTVVYVAVFMAMPFNMVYLALYYVHCKVYVNSMLAALNSRKSLRLLAGQDVHLQSIHLSTSDNTNATASS